MIPLFLDTAAAVDFLGRNGKPEVREVRGEVVAVMAYIARAGAHVKIGHSYQPERRLVHLQTVVPFEVEKIAILPGGQRLERVLHARYARCRVRGEWFAPDAAMETELGYLRTCSLEYQRAIIGAIAREILPC